MVFVNPGLTDHEVTHVSGGSDEIDSALALTAIPEHDKAKHTDRTRTIFIGVDAFYRVGSSVTFKDHYAGYDFDGAAEELFGNVVIPEDYASGGILKAMVIAQAAAAGTCNIKTAHAANSEAHNTTHTDDAAGVVVSGVTFGHVYISTILSLTNLTAGDILGFEFEWVSGDWFVLGLMFEYTAEE